MKPSKPTEGISSTTIDEVMATGRRRREAALLAGRVAVDGSVLDGLEEYLRAARTEYAKKSKP